MVPDPDDDTPHGGAERADPLHAFVRGPRSVARPLGYFYVAATSDELRGAPLRTSIFGIPIVLFRDATGRAAAFLDRCPHRNVPLSLGRVVEGRLECAYHGWRFDADGVCRFVPSRCVQDEARARDATSFPVRELDGFVWVMPSAHATAAREPYRFRLLEDAAGYGVVRRSVSARASLHAALENALDVPHTAFLHRGLFRTESRGVTLTANVERRGDRVEAEYVGEPRPAGVVGRILSPSGGLVRHHDRFLLPSIAEVEYRIGDENHILVAAAMTPVEDDETRIHAVVAFKTRLPPTVVETLVLPIALRIFAQDARILAAQSETIRRFGGERFASTEIDVLGRHITRLLRSAERGEVSTSDDVIERQSITLVV